MPISQYVNVALPFCHEEFNRRGKSVVTSASPHTQTDTHIKQAHTRTHVHTNMTACHHFRASFYQPGLNIDPIDCLKPYFP